MKYTSALKLKLAICLFAIFLFSTGANAQYCTPAPSFGCVFGEYPSQFSMTGTLSSINDPSLSCTGSGYENRTSETCTVVSPSIVNCTITSNLASTPGHSTTTSSGGYSYVSGTNESVQIWVDWNNDFTFAGSESIGGSVPLSGSLDAFTVTIPSGVTAGYYRMRLVLSSNASYPSMDPCMLIIPPFPLSYNTGNSIDYTIRIAPAAACPSPTVTLGATTCTSQVINWTAIATATSGYEYTINTTAGSPGTPGTSTTALTYTATGLTPGTAYYAHVRANCGGGNFSPWVNVPFNTSISTLPAITGGNTVCVGSALALSDATSGGTWGSVTTTIATVSGTGVVTGVATGSATIVYAQGGCYVTKTVTVTPGISGVTGTTTFCVTGTTNLSDASPGGAWSSSSTAVATVAGGVVHGVTAGTATITYTVGTCTATANVIVESNTVGAITGKDSLCAGGGHVIVLSDAVAGGAWSSSNTARATIDPVTGVLSGVTTGTFTVTYTVINSCGTLTATRAKYVRTALQCATGVYATTDEFAQLKVFPNPNGGIFTINLSSYFDEEVQVEVSNLLGEKITAFNAFTNKTVNVKLKCAPGIYMLSATTAHGRQSVKIVIEK